MCCMRPNPCLWSGVICDLRIDHQYRVHGVSEITHHRGDTSTFWGGRAVGRSEGRTDVRDGLAVGWLGGWLVGWTDARTDGRTDGRWHGRTGGRDRRSAGLADGRTVSRPSLPPFSQPAPSSAHRSSSQREQVVRCRVATITSAITASLRERSFRLLLLPKNREALVEVRVSV